MPIKVDISDIAIERNEQRHQLHVWGSRIQTWDENCVKCGEATDRGTKEEREALRCGCGEGFHCSRRCKEITDALYPFTCSMFRDMPLDSRPSRRHRRALLVLPGQPVALPQLIWIRLKHDKLTIEHPAFDDYFRHIDKTQCWLNLAVVSPSMGGAEPFVFENLGHGLVMGFASSMMNPDRSECLCWATEVTPQKGPGPVAKWPGPMIFFAYGYDISDYVRSTGETPATLEGDTDTEMSDLETWAELDGVRRATAYQYDQHDEEIDVDPLPSHPAATHSSDLDSTPRWRWKVKKRGTSMNILDFSRRDARAAFCFLAAAHINPGPATNDPTREYDPMSVSVSHITDPKHPAYLSSCHHDFAQRGPAGTYDRPWFLGHGPVIEPWVVDRYPAQHHLLAGATAVGLP